MFQAKIDCWWLNFMKFSRQEADVTVFWDMFQVKLAMGHLCSIFQVGAPYITIYIDGPIQCSCHRILKRFYHAQGPRTAQTFLCCGPGGVTDDVTNVHAPSGKKGLTD